MAYIKLTLDHPLVDGENVTFKAPCDCTAVTGLKVYYVTLTEDAETEVNQTFTFKDAHGNDLTNVGNLFTTGAYIKAILDTTNNYAYIQNADTNAYLENKLDGTVKGETFTITLAYGDWASDGSYNVQTITKEGVQASYPIPPDVDCELTGTDVEGDGAILNGWSKVSIATTAENSLIFKCIADAPEVNIPVIVRIFK